MARAAPVHVDPVEQHVIDTTSAVSAPPAVRVPRPDDLHAGDALLEDADVERILAAV